MDGTRVWVKVYHFWPKNDSEKWSRKNIFEIPPCAHHLLPHRKEEFWSKVIKMTW